MLNFSLNTRCVFMSLTKYNAPIGWQLIKNVIDYKSISPGLVLTSDFSWKVTFHLHSLCCLHDLWLLHETLLYICLWFVACLSCCKLHEGRNLVCLFHCRIPGARAGPHEVGTVYVSNEWIINLKCVLLGNKFMRILYNFIYLPTNICFS